MEEMRLCRRMRAIEIPATIMKSGFDRRSALPRTSVIPAASPRIPLMRRKSRAILKMSRNLGRRWLPSLVADSRFDNSP